MRTIAVIDPAVRSPELEAYNHLVTLSPIPLTYHLPALFGMDSLIKATAENQTAGIIIFGSLASVNAALPWQSALIEWLTPRLTGGVPTFGICYGHQLIAKIFGAPVEFAAQDKKKRVGLREVSLKENPLWGAARTGSLSASHEETVVSAPEEFQIAGQSREIPTDVLNHVRLPIWTFQTHPEARPGFLERRGSKSSEASCAFGQDLVKRFLEFAAKHG